MPRKRSATDSENDEPCPNTESNQDINRVCGAVFTDCTALARSWRLSSETKFQGNTMDNTQAM